MEIFLETERLILRRFTAADAGLLVELDSDPAVMQYINGGRSTPLEEIEGDILPHWLKYYRQYPGYGFWAAHEKASGRFLGWFHLRPGKENPDPTEPDLGYRLHRSEWGKGYATEGSRALIDKAFAELGARRVFATTMTVNVGSRRVMEKAGLRFVRTFFMEWPEYIAGAEHGDVEYAITREEWAQGQGIPPHR